MPLTEFRQNVVVVPTLLLLERTQAAVPGWDVCFLSAVIALIKLS